MSRLRFQGAFDRPLQRRYDTVTETLRTNVFAFWLAHNNPPSVDPGSPALPAPAAITRAIVSLYRTDFNGMEHSRLPDQSDSAKAKSDIQMSQILTNRLVLRLERKELRTCDSVARRHA
ncbi:MAG TPA: hypothetical protein VI457_02450 [Methylococcaceae bacterium]|nr:hypothetical protein [Methylococcaceae bacterium]